MTVDWKLKQEIYHRLNTEYKDDLKDVDITLVEGYNIVSQAVRHFNEKVDEWIYPSKSYFVAICYAKWLAEDYGGRPLDYLNDSDLLYGNDPYFKPYEEDPSTYVMILQHTTWDFDETEGMVPEVREYYDAEFGYE